MPVTFFVPSGAMNSNNSTAITAHQDGHLIASYGDGATALTTANLASLRSILTVTDDAINAALCRRPRLVRPPNGELSQQGLALVSSLGYKVSHPHTHHPPPLALTPRCACSPAQVMLWSQGASPSSDVSSATAVNATVDTAIELAINATAAGTTAVTSVLHALPVGAFTGAPGALALTTLVQAVQRHNFTLVDAEHCAFGDTSDTAALPASAAFARTATARSAGWCANAWTAALPAAHDCVLSLWAPWDSCDASTLSCAATPRLRRRVPALPSTAGGVPCNSNDMTDTSACSGSCTCGDGVCSGTEWCGSCPQDCGPCPALASIDTCTADRTYALVIRGVPGAK